MQLVSETDFDAILPNDILNRRVALVINISALKAHSGALWDKLSKGVFLRLDKILRRVLTPADCFAPVDDTRYLVATPGLDAVDASVTAVRIAGELIFEILGHCDVEQIRIERVIAREGRSLTTVGIALDEVAKLVEKAHLSGVGGIATRRQTAQEPARAAMVAGGERALTISHCFEPVWDMRNEAITTYLCVPEKIVAQDSDEVAPADHLSLKERSTVEISCILHGVGFLSEFVEKGDRFVLGLPVGFDTLCAPIGRMEFVRVCRGLPAAYRPYLLFLLNDVPLGVTQSRLSDLASLIRPFGRVAVTVAGGCRNFNAYQGHGFCALAIDLAKASPTSQRITRDIVHVAAAAANSRMGSIALGLSESDLLNQACAADIQMLQGPAIAPPVGRPKRMTRLGRASVLKVGENANEEWF